MEKRRCGKILAGLIVFALLVFSVQPLHSVSLVTVQDSAIAQAPTETPSMSKRKGLPAPALADRDGDGLSDGLQAKLAGALPTDLFDVVVTFARPDHAAVARKAVGPLKVKREFTIIPGFAATMSAAQARGLTKARGVLRVEEDFAVSTMLDAARDDFGVSAVQDGLFYDGSGVGICVVDTGVDPLHEQLNGGKVVAFVDYVNGRTDPYDDHGHGTHVSSIAAGDGMGDPSAATFKGVAPGAVIYAAKVLDALGQGSDSDVIAGVQWCAEQSDVDVISMSLGSSLPSDGGDSLSLAVNSAVLDRGKVVVVAAGNSGDGPGTVSSPGAAEEAITVGAAAEWSAPGDAPNHSDGIYLAPFSSRGPTLDGREKPDILAPGVSVTSAQAGTQNGYVTWSGTSMATPFVAGTAALALQAFPDALDPSLLKDRMTQSAHRHFALADSDWGAGLVDAAALLKSLEEALYADDALLGPSTTFPQLRRETLAVPRGGVGEYVFEIGEDALSAPVAVGITIADGEQICLYGSPFICDLLGGWAWTPDFDADLIRVAGGVETVVASSICPLQGECGAAGRQETLHFLPVADNELGTYLVRVAQFPDDPGGLRDGVVLLDISTGPALLNARPVANAGGDYSGMEDEVIAFDGTASTDPEGDPLTFRWDFGDGATAMGPTPGHVYSGSGIYTLTLMVNDGHSDSEPDTAVVTVAEVNNPPVANDQSVDTDENIAVEIVLTASDVEDDPLSYSVESGPLHGSLSGDVPSLTYAPDAHYIGADSFTFKVNDGAADSNVAKVSITIKPIIEKDEVIIVLADYKDKAGQLLVEATSTAQPNAVLTVDGYGLMTFSAADDKYLFRNKVASKPASVTVTSSLGGSAVVTLDAAANTPPVANDDAFTVAKSSNDNALDVLANDSDPNGDSLSITFVGNPSSEGSSVTINATSDGLLYTPAANFVGSETFAYTAYDGKGGSDTATVTVTVASEGNLPPTAEDDYATTTKNTSIPSINLVANDSDRDGTINPDTVVIVTGPMRGATVAPPINGTVLYTPKKNFVGTDSFTYTVKDNEGATSDEATVWVIVKN